MRWFLFLGLFAGCLAAPVDEPEPEPIPEPVPRDSFDFLAGGARATNVHVPAADDDAAPVPLLVFLHGYGAPGEFYENSLRLTDAADERGFVYTFPNGTVDADGQNFWNASPACCDFFGARTDDVGFLRGLVEEIQGEVAIDDERIYVMGHSNGAFMSQRFACENADLVAAMVSISGSSVPGCDPSEPISALMVHGTADTTVAYNGGVLAAPFASAQDTVELWAGLGGCTNTPRVETELADIDASVQGPETTITIYDDECEPGGRAELWTVTGAGHVIQPSTSFVPKLLDFLNL